MHNNKSTMADISSYPQISNSLSLSPVIFNPQNHLNPSLLSLPEFAFSCSDSQPETCFCDMEIEPKIDSFDSDYPDENEIDDQVSFVTNLFDRSSVDSPLRLTLGNGEGSNEVDLELGLGLGLSRQGSVSPLPPSTGLRVVSFDSDSDSDDEEIDVGLGGVSDFDRPPFCWDYLGFNDQRNNDLNDEQFEVDDNGIDDGIDEGVFFGQCHDDDDDDEVETLVMDMDEAEREIREVSLVFDTYQERAEQEIMIPSDTDDGGELDVEEAIRDLEWEILLAVNNFNREVFDMDINVNMYDAILNEVEERMNDWRGSPPTANSVMENLPIVRLSNASLKENHIVCAICKDDILVEEAVRQLPCSHYYHGDCIFPWLKIRNTCPVCRYELPTDDPNYEYMKREREGPSTEGDVSLELDSQVGFDFHVFL